MNVLEMRAQTSDNVKTDISLKDAKDLLEKINFIIYEQSALETALEYPEDADKTRAYGFKRIAEVLGIEI